MKRNIAIAIENQLVNLGFLNRNSKKEWNQHREDRKRQKQKAKARNRRNRKINRARQQMKRRLA
jgi:hypothetical protein